VDNPLQTISLTGVAIGFIPVIIVLLIMYRWSQQAGMAIYAVARMLLQLIIVGYLLTYIFDINHGGFVLVVLTIMLSAACWISLRSVRHAGRQQYLHALAAIVIGGVSTLFLVTGLVLEVTPWFSPRHVIPLGGMIFAAAMNAVSLAAERYEAARQSGKSVPDARQEAFHVALIPIFNSLFAVGLVTLPGMMTGQILSGTSPLVAARYQIVVMCMLLGAAGISAAVYLLMTGVRTSASTLKKYEN